MRLRFELIDREQTELGELTLYRYEAATGEEGYEVRIDEAFLMATHGAVGEVAMAELARQRVASSAGDLHVLVGGLGAGHTLRAALALPAVAAVEVVEISAKVVDWNRRFFGGPGLDGIDDPRVTVSCADLSALLPRRTESYDIELLDVDNGPGWLAAEGNRRLYERAGLEACRQALRPGGVVAFWLPQQSPVLAAALREVFGNVEEVDTAELDTTEPGPSDVVVLARRR